MPEYTACLNVAFAARDEDEAAEILNDAANALLTNGKTPFGWKMVYAEIDDLEEI